jgi:hypothetical protein
VLQRFGLHVAEQHEMARLRTHPVEVRLFRDIQELRASEKECALSLGLPYGLDAFLRLPASFAKVCRNQLNARMRLFVANKALAQQVGNADFPSARLERCVDGSWKSRSDALPHQLRKPLARATQPKQQVQGYVLENLLPDSAKIWAFNCTDLASFACR